MGGWGGVVEANDSASYACFYRCDFFEAVFFLSLPHNCSATITFTLDQVDEGLCSIANSTSITGG